MKPREPRAYARDLTASVLAHGRRAVDATVADISVSGALLDCSESFAVGDQVLLSLHADADREPFAVWAVIMRVDGGRLAVAFQPGRALRRLESFVRGSVARERAQLYLVCVALERDLRMLGLNVVTAQSPLEVIHHVERLNFAAVVIDAALGLGLLAIIADMRPGVRRVVLGENIASQDEVGAMASGLAHALLLKPWDRNALASALLISP